MQAAYVRYLGAALWPVSIWTSLGHLDEHGADDYVERTTPIVATAIGFWACVGTLIALLIASGRVIVFGDDGTSQIMHRTPSEAIGALFVIAPVLYIIGAWLYNAREALYRPKP